MLRQGSTVILPQLVGPSPVARTPQLSLPSPTGEVRGTTEEEQHATWRVERDLIAGETRVIDGHVSDDAVETGVRSSERYDGATGVSVVDPGVAWAEGHASFTLEWPEVTVGTEVRTRLESDHDIWHVTVELEVTEDGATRWTRRWDRRLARDLA